jgi:hypothetical protein
MYSSDGEEGSHCRADRVRLLADSERKSIVIVYAV